MIGHMGFFGRGGCYEYEEEEDYEEWKNKRKTPIMTREEAIEMLKKDKGQRGNCFISDALDMAIKSLDQESSRDMAEIAEVMNCDADAETKCRMISDILSAKPHYFEMQEPKESEDRE